jgi:four helix bundle protein
MEFIDIVRPYRIAEQIAASSMSVPSNIAEGAERGTIKEFKRFLEC